MTAHAHTRSAGGHSPQRAVPELAPCGVDDYRARVMPGAGPRSQDTLRAAEPEAADDCRARVMPGAGPRSQDTLRAAEPEAADDATGPLSDDLAGFLSAQLLPPPRAPRSEPPVRQRGTLPGRLSPLRFTLRMLDSRPVAHLAWGADRLWSLGGEPMHVACVTGRAPLAHADYMPVPDGASPCSVAVCARGELLVGDAWQGAACVLEPSEPWRPLSPLADARAPVGALSLAADDEGGAWGLDGLGRVSRISSRGVEACGFDAGGRVAALACFDGTLWLLMRDAEGERFLLRRPLSAERDIDLGGAPPEGETTPLFFAGASGLLVLGVGAGPLLLGPGERRARVLSDIEGAQRAACLSSTTDDSWALTVRTAGRDVIWLREGDRDSVVLDLGEPLEPDDGKVIEAPGFAQALVADPQKRVLFVGTGAGLFELALAEGAG